VLDHDFPDPEALQVGDTYYAFSTNSGDENIQTARSNDLVHWELLGDALPKLPSWAVQDFGWAWAPGLAKPVGYNAYLMYFTARFAMGYGGIQCIGVAQSQEPSGPYQPQGANPFICQHDEGGSIDAAYFADEDGSEYLLWKSDANSHGGSPDIFIQRLSADGLTLEGDPVLLISVDQRWEGTVIEGPVLWQRDGKYFLFYSANNYASPDYAIGYAVADSPTGPYTKASEPLLKTILSAGIVGPGGEEVVTGPDGDTWMLFHTWTPGAYRALALAKLDWEGDTPVIRSLTRDAMPAP
jgi:beta-xylosidase